MATVNDPVCGMPVDTETAVNVEYRGKRFYFCRDLCRLRFADNPGQYTDA